MKARRWRTYAALCILLVLPFLGKTESRAAGTVTVLIDKTSLDVGDTLQVTVQTSEPEDDAVPPEITLTYNAELLNFTYCSTQYGG
ncbi:MAG: hypothetical protein IJ711_08420, partial [Lachnospiraceae bacterium]|nr:hypothetical protein [Lachnospiraceae bacterium]